MTKPVAQELQHPNWCFTLQFGDSPSIDQETAEALVRAAEPKATYIICGREVAPTTGQRHLQGYIQLKKPARITELRKVIPCHWEPAVADDEKNYNYCSKEGDFWEFGTRRELNPGKREKLRWQEAKDSAIAGDLGSIDPQIFVSHYMSLRSIQKDFMTMPDRLQGPCGFWYHGAAGAGKSFKAREDFPSAYFKMCNKWWDGYQGEENVILDDFDKGHNVLGHHLKIWADEYPFVAEIKGTACAIRPKAFVITSQYSPEDIWQDSETLEAIRRRFKVTRFGLPTDAPKRLRAVFNAPHPVTPVIDLTKEDTDDEENDDESDSQALAEALARSLPMRRSTTEMFSAPFTTPMQSISRLSPTRPQQKRQKSVTFGTGGSAAAADEDATSEIPESVVPRRNRNTQ